MVWRVLRVVLVMAVVTAVVAAWSSGAVVRSQAEPLQADAPLGNAITYQGWLQQGGAAVEGACDLRFALYTAANGGSQVGGTLDRLNHPVTGGYFTVNDLDFGAAFTGQARWLAVSVRCPAGGNGDFTALTPRQALTAAPYSLYARNNWALAGNSETSGANFVGTTDPVTLTLKVSNTVALRLLPHAAAPSVVGGIAENSVSAGVLGATIAGGGGPDSGLVQNNRVTDDYGVIGGGVGNQAGDNAGTTGDRSFATVGGGRGNTASGLFATIGGGQAHAATNTYATVGGGVENNATGYGATIGGGQTNGAGGENATVGGGIENIAAAANATVGGGFGNDATGENATVGGGLNNLAGESRATVSGGSENAATGDYAVIGGGGGNKATGSASTIGGGAGNETAGQNAVVAGGFQNQAQGLYATVVGGIQNIAAQQFSFVGGGYQNQATGSKATVGGGESNLAGGSYATVAGGYINQATGTNATIGGGSQNLATANFATVSGGVDANASHIGEWAYAVGGFDNAITGEAQTSLYVMRGTTLNAGSTDLRLGDFGERLTIAPGRTVAFEIQVAARSVGGESAGYQFSGVIENHLGITVLVGAVTKLSESENDANWNATVTADDANDSLKITVTGASGDDVRWVATVRTTEVQY